MFLQLNVQDCDPNGQRFMERLLFTRGRNDVLHPSCSRAASKKRERKFSRELNLICLEMFILKVYVKHLAGRSFMKLTSHPAPTPARKIDSHWQERRSGERAQLICFCVIKLEILKLFSPIESRKGWVTSTNGGFYTRMSVSGWETEQAPNQISNFESLLNKNIKRLHNVYTERVVERDFIICASFTWNFAPMNFSW